MLNRGLAPWLCVAFGLLAAGRAWASAPSAAAWSQVEPIPGTLRVNGVRLEAIRVSGACDPQIQLEALRSAWSDELHPPLIGAVTQRGQWWLLDRFVDRWHESWQLRRRDGGGCEGYASRMDLRAAPTQIPSPPLRMPIGVTRQRVIESLDATHRYIQWTFLLAPTSTTGLRRELLAAAGAASWVISSQSGDELLQWQRSRDSLQCQFLVIGAQRWMLLSLWREV